MRHLTPDLLLNAYASGIFPMAIPEENNQIAWFAPDPRAILPLDGFHLPFSLRRVLRQGPFEVTTDLDFAGVMAACAAPRSYADKSWISDEFIRVYTRLHEQGFAHSIECWHAGKLAGGLYGVSLGAAFFGESMFHTERDASKVALAHLVALLRRQGYTLLDVQFTTSHLLRFGVVELPRVDYEIRLMAALDGEAEWPVRGALPAWTELEAQLADHA